VTSIEVSIVACSLYPRKLHNQQIYWNIEIRPFTSIWWPLVVKQPARLELTNGRKIAVVFALWQLRWALRKSNLMPSRWAASLLLKLQLHSTLRFTIPQSRLSWKCVLKGMLQHRRKFMAAAVTAVPAASSATPPTRRRTPGGAHRRPHEESSLSHNSRNALGMICEMQCHVGQFELLYIFQATIGSLHKPRFISAIITTCHSFFWNTRYVFFCTQYFDIELVKLLHVLTFSHS